MPEDLFKQMQSSGVKQLPSIASTCEVAMADNLAGVLEREGPRGRVIFFAHNCHIQKHAEFPNPDKRAAPLSQLAPQINPAGLYLQTMLGPEMVVIGAYFGAAGGLPEGKQVLQTDPEGLEVLLGDPDLPAYLIDLLRLARGGPVWPLDAGRSARPGGGLFGERTHRLAPALSFDAILYIRCDPHDLHAEITGTDVTLEIASAFMPGPLRDEVRRSNRSDDQRLNRPLHQGVRPIDTSGRATAGEPARKPSYRAPARVARIRGYRGPRQTLRNRPVPRGEQTAFGVGDGCDRDPAGRPRSAQPAEDLPLRTVSFTERRRSGFQAINRVPGDARSEPSGRGVGNRNKAACHRGFRRSIVDPGSPRRAMAEYWVSRKKKA